MRSWGQGSERRAEQEKDRQTEREREKARKSRLGFEVVVNEGRKTERSELEKTENLCVDPYCGGRKELSSKGHETETNTF